MTVTKAFFIIYATTIFYFSILVINALAAVKVPVTPEPVSCTLFILGGAALAAGSRAKKNRKNK
jgi:hypothetical protein